MTKLMTLMIHCKEVYEVKTTEKIFRQILFDGYAEGEYFNGKILPGGVDTQIEYTDGSGILSARYLLEGMDSSGKECRMYIENTGHFHEDITEPVIYTDSQVLEFLNGCKLVGEMKTVEGQFMIDVKF